MSNSINFDYLAKKYSFIKDLPGFIFIKDLDLNFIAATSAFTDLVGFDYNDQVIQKADYELPCELSKYANIFRKEDKKILNTGKGMKTLEIYPFSTGWKVNLVSKNILTLYGSRKLGVFCQLIDVTDSGIYHCGISLNSSDQNIKNTSYVPTTYILNSEHCPLPNLSSRQQECVFLMVRGKTLKEIAFILGISQRTVESYMEHIKHKLGCYNKGQIIEKAITNGFLYYIPQRFFK